MAENWQRAVILNPWHVEAHSNIGNIHSDFGRNQEAVLAYRKALAIRPEYASAYCNMGNLFMEHNRDKAVQLTRWAILLKPDSAGAHGNLGAALNHRDSLEEMAKSCLKAVIIEPNSAEFLNNLGVSLRKKQLIVQAMMLWKRAIVIDQNFVDAHLSMANSLFVLGRYEEGWQEFAWRWRRDEMLQVLRGTIAQQWQGEKANGKKILLIYVEGGGLGDCIQHCRFALMAVSRGWRVVLEVQRTLVRLLQSLSLNPPYPYSSKGGTLHVIAQEESVHLKNGGLGKADYYCPMGDLPGILMAGIDDVRHAAYLYADAELVEKWRQRLITRYSAKPKIGLVWAGNRYVGQQDSQLLDMDAERSIPLELLRPLFDLPGIVFFNLQKDEPPTPVEFGLVSVMEEMHDFADTAALIANLDLVIGVDTAVAHLAAAMGKKVWLMDRFDHCWRWIRGREDSPWYPSLRIFRQPVAGDWDSVIRKVRDEIEAFCFGVRNPPYPPFSKGGTLFPPPLEKGGRGDFSPQDFKHHVILQPDKGINYFNLGSFFLANGDISAVAKNWERTIRLNPTHVEAHGNLGNIYSDLGKIQKAMFAYRKALVIQPEYGSAYCNMGVLCMDHLRDDATRLLQRAIFLQHDSATAHGNLGVALNKDGSLDEMAESCLKSVVIEPNSAQLYNNLGVALRKLQRIEDAITLWQRTIAIVPDHIDAHLSIAFSLLVLGRWKEGWPEFRAWRWQRCLSFLRGPSAQHWQGEKANGDQTLLIYRDEEVGLGDCIQHSRFALLAKNMGWKVVLEVKKPLVRLLEGLDGVERVIAQGDRLPKIDFYCPISDLPAILGVGPDDVKRSAYLYADTELVEKWRQRLVSKYGVCPKIGLVWAGNRFLGTHDSRLLEMDAERSIPLELLRPIFDLPGIVFFNLQKDEPPAPAELGLVDVMEEIQDFYDTAALVANLDLVIAVDTAVAHLAGAMGKKVWLMDRFEHCWRWIRGREDSPWYPAMRIFRQPVAGDWDSVIRKVCGELESFCFGEAKSPLPPFFKGGEYSHPPFSKGGKTYPPPLKKGGGGDFLPQDAKPNSAAWQNNIAVAIEGDGRLAEALPFYGRAVCLQPDNADLWANLGYVLRRMKFFTQAEKLIKTSIKINFDSPEAHFALAQTLLVQGKYAEGMREYEWRWRLPENIPIIRNFNKPLWKGESGQGRRLFIHHEGGLGDVIQSCRFLRVITAMGWRIIVETVPSLVRLLKNMGVAEKIISSGDKIPRFDVFCPLGSLPFILGTVIETIPPCPYLEAKSADVKMMQKKIDEISKGRLKVGLVWSGGVSMPDRSFSPKLLRRVTDAKNICFLSLQKDNASFPADLPLADCSGWLNDFADTAAMIANLDMVISVDTATAHLAGAMGKPVWMLVKHDADWRWLHEREDSPWYSSMRIFRQETPGDWEGVIERVRMAIGLGGKNPSSPPFPKGGSGDCSAIIDSPDSAERYYNFANLLLHDNKLEAATSMWLKTVKIYPYFAQAHTNIGNALSDIGHVSLAILFYLRAIVVSPSHNSAYSNLWILLKDSSLLDSGMSSCLRVVKITPANAEAHDNLGKMLEMDKNRAEALTSYKKALVLQCNFIRAYLDLAHLFLEQKMAETAMVISKRALLIDPTDAGSHFNIGLVKIEQGLKDDAHISYQRAIILDPGHGDGGFYNNFGTLLQDRGYRDEALRIYSRLTRLKPDHALAHNNISVINQIDGDIDDGLLSCRKALVLKPDNADIWANEGCSLNLFKRLNEAVTASRRAILIDGDCIDGHHNLSMMLLTQGHLAEGWRELEWRWQSSQLIAGFRNFPVPQWYGEIGSGGKLLIHAEQGMGDALQFCRYAPLAAARGWRVIVEAPMPLIRLLQTLPDIEQCVPLGEKLPQFDAHCPMMSLPLAFNTELDTIPSFPAYLHPDKKSVEEWAKRLSAAYGNSPRVGLVWAGNPRRHSPELTSVDRRRSIHPDLLSPILACSGINFFSLQKDGPPAPEEWGLIDFMEEMDDFADTAALVANLDLVISVDTSMVHVAGAIGKTVWLLDRFDSCWRWMEGRDDSPWYPNLRIFRQKKPLDWGEVVQRVRLALPYFFMGLPGGKETSESSSLRLTITSDSSIQSGRYALIFDPGNVQSYVNLVLSLRALRQFSAAVIIGRWAILLAPESGYVRNNLFETMMSAGEYHQGWQGGVFGWRNRPLDSTAQLVRQLISKNIPFWNGEPGNGRRLVVYQDFVGFGDIIQFCRYLPLVAAKGWRIILVVTHHLARLMANFTGVERVIVRDSSEISSVDCDAHCYLPELPFLFDTTLETIPPVIPINANPIEANSWKQRLEIKHDHVPRVGLVWAGNSFAHLPPSNSLVLMNHRRSLSPELLVPLFARNDVHFFSLQVEDVPIPENVPLFDYMDEVKDFAETSAFISNLDLVISVDTSVVHLAATMGKTVWLLNRFDNCWRWLRYGQDDSPWYPSVRIFRQPAPGDWASVIKLVVEALDEHFPRTQQNPPYPPFSKGGYKLEKNLPPLKKGGRGDFADDEQIFINSLLSKAEDYKKSDLYDDAISSFRQIIILNPSSALAYDSLGQIFEQRMRLDESILHLFRSTFLQNYSADAAIILGLVQKKRKQTEENARQTFLAATVMGPDSAVAIFHLAVRLYDQGIYDKAMFLWRRTIIIQQDIIGAHRNLGTGLLGIGMFDQSVQACRNALILGPGDVQSYINFVLSLRASRQFSAAVRIGLRATLLAPQSIQVHSNLFEAVLSSGKYREGWQEWMFDWRRKPLDSTPQLIRQLISKNIPFWNGELGNGGRMVVYQNFVGFGDVMQFCRYLPLVAARGWRIILVVVHYLARLMEGFPGVEQVIPLGHGEISPVDCDTHCYLPELPSLFDTILETIPPVVPIHANVREASLWKQRLEIEHGHVPKVGLVWAGNSFAYFPPSNPLVLMNRRRSIPPELLAHLFARKDIHFFSLQREDVPFPENVLLFDYMGEVDDFADTAAFISNLDLVISVDTAVVHLAATMGKPVWILNRFDTCWRWLRYGQDDSPWYPLIRIFRQPSPGDWVSVIRQVSEALDEYFPEIHQNSSHSLFPKGGRGDFVEV